MTGRATWQMAWVALASAAVAGSVLRLAAHLVEGPSGVTGWWWASLAAAAVAGACASAIYVRHAFGRRLRRIATLLDERMDERAYLSRLPDLGDDDVGRIGAAFNRLLARITALTGNVLDQERELILAHELAEKRAELAARHSEQAILFEVLRESASSHDLNRVLRVLVGRVGPTMRLRELVVLLREGESYVFRCAWGFENPSALIGREIKRPDSILGLGQSLILIPDVSRIPAYEPLWEAASEGSFAAVPIHFRGDPIGLIALTRAVDDPLGEREGRYLQALADQAALAIHEAQLVGRLEALSTRDELTGLANRRLFGRRLERALAHADRFGEPLSVLALDVDHFKRLNDTNGHAAGDAALVALARTLEANVRTIDTVARVGGEEIWILLPGADAAGAHEAAEKVRSRIAGLDVEGASAQPLGHLSVSIGLAERRPNETADEVLRRADEALYAAKRGGRDRVAA